MNAISTPQPLSVVTNAGLHGAVVLGALFIVVAAAGIVYWRLLAVAESFTLAGLIAMAVVALAAAWLAPMLFSSDVYAYAAYGELARLGIDPYARPAIAGNDALLRNAAWQWNGAFPICVYGPAFVYLAKIIVGALAPAGTLAQLQGMRAIATAALVACVPLAFAAFPNGNSQRLRAAATIGLNPVAIWCAAEGHNDALALAVTLAGFALVQRGSIGIGAATAALSALVKPPGAFAAVALAVVDRRARLGAAIGFAIAIALSMPLFGGLATQLAPHGRYLPQASLQAVFAPLGAMPAAALAAGVAALLVTRGARLIGQQHSEGWIWLGLAAWVLIPNPYPWYGVWLVALAALAPRSRASAVAIGLSFAAMLRYVPDAVATPNAPLAVALGVLATFPLLGLLI
ncbi:MAG: hypothetical protein JO104_06320 [Candidatus Eremiobacteraeota bacterium]|nr:hypothetical protein [Candidatus Eremiobacteraeota bacterium]